MLISGFSLPCYLLINIYITYTPQLFWTVLMRTWVSWKLFELLLLAHILYPFTRLLDYRIVSRNLYTVGHSIYFILHFHQACTWLVMSPYICQHLPFSVIFISLVMFYLLCEHCVQNILITFIPLPNHFSVGVVYFCCFSICHPVRRVLIFHCSVVLQFLNMSVVQLFFPVTIDYFCSVGIIAIYHLTIYVKIYSWVLYLNQLVSMSLCQYYTILIFTDFHLFLLFLLALRIVLAIQDLLKSYINFKHFSYC